LRILKKYFNEFSSDQEEKFEALFDLYFKWNSKINLISRKDFNNFYERHVLHSLAISKVLKFNSDESILDVGTGGGFPGIPLAILFPNTCFYLIDKTKKKIKVVNSIKKSLELNNVNALSIDVNDFTKKVDFIVARAVTNMKDFQYLVRNKATRGIFYLKGGDLSYEKSTFENVQFFNINKFFNEPFFETKKIVYIPID
tara:strand:+ start:63236 stop:63832 length:597 start_codon:yes stop_codon:yes gene_type:complete